MPLAAAPTQPGAEELIRQSNTRDMGEPGYRRVQLELLEHGQITGSFTIVNIWRRFGDELRVFFFLDAPANLRGTAFLLRERMQASPEMTVHFYLPAGEARVRPLGAESLKENLLGSEFSYFDLRFTFPTAGIQFNHTGIALPHGERIEALAEDSTIRGWARARLQYDSQSQLLTAVDYYPLAAQEGSPAKRLRIVTQEKRQGVWTPTNILAYERGTQASRLMLLESDFHFTAASTLRFEPEELPMLVHWLKAAASQGNRSPP